MALADPLDPNTRTILTLLERDEIGADPALLALHMARHFQPTVDVESHAAAIQALAERVRAKVGDRQSPAAVIAAINAVLFAEEGYEGNEEAYYEPANSFLNEVMERKKGIPISLSVLYLSVAGRLGYPVFGIALPLHFIVKFAGESDILIDPFHRGKIMTVAECQERVEKAYGAPVPLDQSCLEPVAPRHILYRMLNNLKYVFLRQQDPHRAGRATDLMLLLRSDQPDDVRDRGLLYMQEHKWREAIEMLSRYLDENRDAPDVALITRRLQDACDARARLN